MVGRLIILAVFLALLAGCNREEKRNQEIIERGVELNVDQFRKRQEALCKQKAIDKAIVIADSILRVEGPKSAVDIGKKPPPASKPVKPPVKHLPDSLKHDDLHKDGQ